MTELTREAKHHMGIFNQGVELGRSMQQWKMERDGWVKTDFNEPVEAVGFVHDGYKTWLIVPCRIAEQMSKRLKGEQCQSLNAAMDT